MLNLTKIKMHLLYSMWEKMPQTEKVHIICSYCTSSNNYFTFFFAFPNRQKVLEYSDQIRLDEFCYSCQLNIHMLLPNNVSRQVLNLIWASPPRQISIKRRWRQSGRHLCRGQSSSPLRKNTRALPLQQLSPYKKGVDGASLLKFADRHIITDGRPTTTGSGKLYFKKEMRKRIWCDCFSAFF